MDRHMPYLNSIPEEINIVINEKLPLHSKYLLSQTCRRQRRITACNRVDQLRELRRNPLPEYTILDFWLGLAYHQPSAWVCKFCEVMHFVRESNAYGAPFWYCWKFQERAVSYDTGYDLGIQHIYLALKYSRLGHDQIQALAKALPPHPPLDRGDEWYQSYQAHSKILFGHFVLKESRVFQTAYLMLPEMGRVSVCPHAGLFFVGMRIYAFSHLPPNRRLLSDVTELFNNPDQALYQSCARCWTDFFVQVGIESTVINSWRNLGSESTLTSPRFEDQFWPTRAEIHMQSAVEHIPGSIRILFEEENERSLRDNGCDVPILEGTASGDHDLDK